MHMFIDPFFIGCLFLSLCADYQRVNYSRGEAEPSQQINEAHKACLAAKELGGKKAHECGTWLLKQKEAVPYGEWIRWVEKNCEFDRRTASRYLAVAQMDGTRVSQLSLRDALWEVAAHKAFHTALSMTVHPVLGSYRK